MINDVYEEPASRHSKVQQQIQENAVQQHKRAGKALNQHPGHEQSQDIGPPSRLEQSSEISLPTRFLQKEFYMVISFIKQTISDYSTRNLIIISVIFATG